MLIRSVLLALTLLLALLSGSDARIFSKGIGGAVPSAGQMISSVPLSNTTFAPGSSSGTIVGVVGTPIMSPGSPAFSGSCCTISGADQASFQKVGSNLETNGVLCGSPPCTYHINLVATQAGISNSPFPQAVTITSSSAVGSLSFVNNGSGSTPGSTFPVHFLKTFAPGDVPTGQIAVPTVGGSPIAYGVDCAADGVNPLRSDGCPSWPDGSLKAIPVSAFLPQLTTGATEQVVFNIQTGSYSTTSTITPASITAVSDYNVILTDVNSSWVPQNYNEWPNGVQIGCQVSGGAVTGCNLRITNPSVASAGGTACNFIGIGIGPSNGGWSATIDNGSGSPGNILTLTSASGAFFAQGLGFVRPEIIDDVGSVIAPNTVLIKQLSGSAGAIGSTYQVSGASQLVANEGMGLVGCTGRINNGKNNAGGGAPAIFTTTLGANNVPTAVNLVTGGSGYTLIGSGTLKFDMNALLNEYGSIQPPTCAAEQGAGAFSSVTYSGGSVTVNATTSGHIAKGQILKDSLGATAVVTGTSSPWAVSAALTSGVMTATTPVCVWAQSSYGGQPLKTSYWVRGPYIDIGTSLADPELIGEGQVDIWSTGGSTYSVRAIVRTGHIGWQPTDWWQSYTYNATMYNGTAKIRGDANGDSNYTGLTDEVPGAWWTADPALSGPLGASAKMDWLGATANTFSESNNLAINAVNPYLATGDITYWRGSRAMLPLVSSLTPTPTIIPVSTSGSSWDDPFFFQGQYQPFGPVFIDDQNAFGNGGTHSFLGAQGLPLSYWIDLTAKASDKGLSWINQMRVSGLALSSVVAGSMESDTGHALNIDPNFSNTAFTDPTRLGSRVFGVFQSFYTPTVPTNEMAIGGQYNLHGDIADTSHWPSGVLLGPYLMDGEYYQLKEMDLMIANAEWSQNDGGGRTLSFNGNNYYGILWDTPQPRVWAWGNQLLTQFVNFAPPQEPDSQYWNWTRNQNYTAFSLWYPYTGSFTWGQGSNSGTKLYDWSTHGAGCVGATPFHLTGSAPFSVGDTNWMCDYAGQVLVLDQMWAGGPGHNTNLDGVVTEVVDNYSVKNGSQNSCAYNSSNYSQVMGNTTTTAPVTSYDNTDIPGSPPGSAGNGYSMGSCCELTSTASSSTLTFATNGNNAPNPPTSGSILNPTQWYTTNENAGSPVPPSPLVIGTWYTWCTLTTTPTITGTINPYGTSCSSQAPITMSTGTLFSAGWIINHSCPTPPPAGGDWAFNYNFTAPDGYPAGRWAVYNWRVAEGGSTSDLATAISNYSTAGMGPVSGGVNWTTLPNWDACSAFSC